jgi:catechol 2,3-dioxygenase-like lactoylglutathione lyase family enzyme
VLRIMSENANAGLSIGNIAIWVRDLQRSVDFYTNGLGLDVLATVDAGDIQEVIVGRSALGGQLMLAARDGEPSSTPVGIWKVFLTSQDAATDFARALSAGAVAVAEPYDIAKFGVTIAVVQDPDGYLLEIGQVHPR